MNEPRRITERYRLDKRITSQGSTIVFRAADTLSGETVAVKLIQAGDSAASREAFRACLATLQEIRHPALPRILDFGQTTEGSFFLVTGYLDGDDLGNLVEIAPARALALLLQLVEGLAAMAARGLSLRNLAAENLRIVQGPEGEQVKILGLGSAAFLPAGSDLRAFAQLAIRTLGLSIGMEEEGLSVDLPLHVAGSLAEPERLRELLEAGLQDGPAAPPPNWEKVRQALRAALFGSGEHPARMLRADDFVTRVIRPEELAHPTPILVPPPLPPLPPPAASQPPAGKGVRVALLAGAPVAALLLATAGVVAWIAHRPAGPERQLSQKPAVPQPVPQPAPRQEPPTQPGQPQVPAVSEAQQRQIWDGRLARGLSTGDLQLLRAVIASPPEAATLTPEQKKGLARARKILDLDKRLTRAQREKDRPAVLQEAALLLAELPGNARVQKARTEAAEALLAESDAHAAQGELDAALAALGPLRESWSDHPGLTERLERLRAQQSVDEQMKETLAEAMRAEQAGHPRDGLRALDQVHPTERWAERFQQARERLQAQLAQLDRNPPQVSRAGAAEPSYEKGATVTVRLSVADDQHVESVEAWARPEGGRFTRVAVRPLGSSDYQIEITPDLHQNRNIDFYVTATDPSGHTGSLGSAEHPQRIKRKKWFSKILGEKDGG